MKCNYNSQSVPAKKFSFRAILYPVLFVLLSISSNICASVNDSLYTVYRNDMYFTRYQTTISATKETVANVTDCLVSDFYSPGGRLFDWAFKDLGLQSKNNEVIVVYKSSSYNPKTGLMRGVFDVEVPHFNTFRNVMVDARVTKSKLPNGIIKIRADILYSGLLLKTAVGILTLIPAKNNTYLAVADSQLGFGWFFNLFITQSRYKSIVEWRVRKFAENIKTECESRRFK